MTPLAPTLDSPAGFVLTEEVGRGGMGVVFRARDVTFDRDVALKVLLGDPSSPAARRFTEEAQITARLQHPGIPAVHQTGTLPDGRPFLVMKLIQGRTLTALLKEKGSGSARWLGVFESICQAVGAAHAAGYIHRDLKPSNVMVGAFGEVQVMDWGLARAVRNAERGVRNERTSPAANVPPIPQSAIGNPQSEDTPPAADDSSRENTDRTNPYVPGDAADGTKAGTILGTPAYMAPEQARGEPVDRRADVFALGAILCQVLTGQPPLSGKPIEVVAAAGAGRFEEAMGRLDGCGEDPTLVALCKRCLSVNPAARPADASEVATAVASFRSESEARVKQAELERGKAETRASETRKRQRLLVGAAGGIAGVLAAGLIASLLLLNRATTAEGQATANADQMRTERDAKEVARQGEEAAKEEAKAAEGRAVVEKKQAVAAWGEALSALRQTTGEDVEKLIGEKTTLTAAEKAYLEAIANRWQAFANRRGDDEQSRALRAEGHLMVAELWQKLGRVKEARAEYERAVPLWEALVADFSPGRRYRSMLARTLNNLGILLEGQGEYAPAAERLSRNLRLVEKLRAEEPDEPSHRGDMATAHNNLGRVSDSLGKGEEADDHYRQAQDLFTSLSADAPADPHYRGELAKTHLNRGVLLAGRQKVDEAEKQYRRAQVLLAKLAADFPGTPAHRLDAARAHNNLGAMMFGIGKGAEATAEIRAALDIRRSLAADFPGIPEYRSDLARAHQNMGVVLNAQGKREEADGQYRESFVVHARLVADFPTVPAYRKDQANGQINFGAMMAGGGKAAEAEAAYRKGIELIAKLAADFPTVPDYRSNLAMAHDNLGLVLSDQKKWADAEGEHASAQAILEKLADDFPAVPAHRVDLATARVNRGEVMYLQGKPADALPLYEKAVEAVRPVYEKDPRGVRTHQAMEIAYRGRAVCLGKLGKHAEAVADWDRAIELTPATELPKVRLFRAIARAKCGRVTEAVAEVAQLEKLSGWTGTDEYTFACFYTLAAGQAADKKAEHLDAAMGHLRQGVKLGGMVAAVWRTDKELDPLRERDDFKALLAELEAKSPKK